MALKHILPNKIYSARSLYEASEGLPFRFCFAYWKRELFTTGSGLKFTKSTKRFNCAYNILGQDYLDFVNDKDTVKKIPYNKFHA